VSADRRADDALLLDRLRDLSLVELDTLLAGTAGQDRTALLDAFVGDMLDGLVAARERIRALQQAARAGGDPLVLLDLPGPRRAAEGGPLRESVDTRLAGVADAYRRAAQLADAVRGVLPLLIAADRRRSMGT